ncbi:hypothetical protein H6F77_12800 [Microcoleus sp. FACHB-831]|uniref:hypothetical protein n=1 Tax=Microcoleus sp. FACHB-831 TaxID=2692827 RepID=UPI001683B52A|nr:hypothetical protein [Microcoleus sp. FACHB-831]MBD1921964.1 hypothetical protein [Microcoleus sp. FACHB-831]
MANQKKINPTFAKAIFSSLEIVIDANSEKPLIEIVRENYDYLEEALSQKNYTHEHLAYLMQKQGWQVASETLKQYMLKVRKERKAKEDNKIIEISRDILQDTSEDILRDTSEDILRDTSEDILQDTSEDILRDTSEDILQDMPSETLASTSNTTSHKVLQQPEGKSKRRFTREEDDDKDFDLLSYR